MHSGGDSGAKRMTGEIDGGEAGGSDEIQVRDHASLRLWLRLLTCYNLIENRLRNELRLTFDTTLPRFDLMAQLARRPEGLKMRDLSRLLMVSGGNVTGLVDRLADEGLIERRDDPRDRRAYSVHLTDAGRDLFARMAERHEGWVVELFGQLDAEDAARLHDILGRLKNQLVAARSAD